MTKVVENTEYELDINPETLCRICLNQDLPLKSVFFSEIIDGNIVNFPSAVESVLDIRIAPHEAYPDKVCTTCRKKIQEFYAFKQKSLTNDRLLKQLYGPYNEVPDKPDEKHLEQQEADASPEEEEILWAEKREYEENAFLKCSQCDAVIETNEDLQEHKETCHIFQCYVCFAVFPGDEELQQHIEMHSQNMGETEEIIEEHPWAADAQEESTDEKVSEELQTAVKEILNVEDELNQLPETCFLCQMNFYGQNIIDQHKDFHRQTFPEIISNTQMFKCSRCCIIFLDLDDLQDHLVKFCPCVKSIESRIFVELANQYLDDPEGGGLRKIVSVEMAGNSIPSLLRCEYCEVEFSDLFTVVDHTNDCHRDQTKDVEKPHTCGVCGDEMSNEKSVRQHIYLEHNKSFDCFMDNCSKSYQTSSKLFQHQFRFHSGDNQLSCTHCFESFPSNAQLMFHQRNDCLALKYECSMCDKRFMTSQGKKQHEFIHKNIKQYECTLCEKRYVSRIELITHTRLHTGEKPYSCNLCNKKFRTLSNKKDHMSTHTLERNYKCEICKAFFKSDRILKGHLKIHQDTKVFKCQECGKSFRRKQHLEAHTKTHTHKKK